MCSISVFDASLIHADEKVEPTVSATEAAALPQAKARAAHCKGLEMRFS